jgi:hypothetical protein
MFSGQFPLKLTGAKAGAGLTGATVQYKFVKFSADNTVVLCSAITDIPCGVLQASVGATGDPVDVVVIGETLLQAGASLSAGAVIGTSTAGQAQAAVATQIAVGQVANVSGATSAGNLLTALVNCAAPSIKA